MRTVTANQGNIRPGLDMRLAFAALAGGLVLFLPLLPVPGPGFAYGPPWKVELLASLFALAFLAWNLIYRRDRLYRVFDLAGDARYRLIVLVLAALVAWTAVSAAWSRLPFTAIQYAFLWAVYLLTVMVVAGYRGSARYVVGVAAAAAAIVAIICWLDFLTVPDVNAYVGTLRIRYGKFAEMLVTLTPLLWSIALAKVSDKRTLWFVVAGASGWTAAMLSLSRGALIAGVVAYAVLFGMAMVYCRGRRWRVSALAAVWLVLTLAFQFGGSLGGAPSTIEFAVQQTTSEQVGDSTSQMRIFTWKVAEGMIRDNWLTGVGANNFGVRFNDYRTLYASVNPSDVDNAIAEDYLVERAHNEPLQILAELGVPGLALFAVAFLLFGFWFVRAVSGGRNLSPLLLGCFAGMCGFAVSSLFSSFSFRAAQNGLAFTMVFGLALKYVLNGRERADATEPDRGYVLVPRLAAGLATVAVLGSFLIMSSIAVSRTYQYVADTTRHTDERIAMLSRAVVFDPDNGYIYAAMSSTLAADDPQAAADLLRTSIEKGRAATQVYSTLANLELESGLTNDAELSMAEAVAVYPRSVFARVRYAQFLEINGKQKQADVQLLIAERIDAAQTRGWYALINHGDMAAFLASVSDARVTPPAQLKPADAVQQFVDRGALARSKTKENE